MYAIKYLDFAELSKVEVKNQPKIIKFTGSKFIPSNAYQILKEDTDGFSREIQKAKDVDAMFLKLLEREGITLSPPEEEDIEAETTKARQRKRSLLLEQLNLDLLELELELEMEKSKKKNEEQ